MPGGVEPSNLGKVFWPEAGVTKGDLLAYMEAVAPFVLPPLRGRPLTVVRFPDGITKSSFYQKDTPKYAPPWIRTVTLPAYGAKKDVRYTVCDSKRTLLWLANQAAIELHPWLSTVDRLERPTHLVMDIDPPEDDFDRAVDAAFLVRDALDDAGLAGAAKTSGSKGVHVYVPLERRYGYDEVRRACGRLADHVAGEAPDLVTTAFRKAEREGRVFLDTGRNAPGAHVVTVYSPRARPAASVSFPVPWDDLRSVQPPDFTVANVPGILEREGDRWAALMPSPQRLPSSLLRD